ncbi:effector-associated constant component EACC1 [Streptomyces sp. NPDC001709]
MGTVEISTEDPDDFDVLFGELQGRGGIVVDAAAAPMEPGDLGSVVDLLTAACASGGAVAVFLGIVKSLLDSRGPGFVMKVRCGTVRLKITADTFEEARPVLEEWLGGA